MIFLKNPEPMVDHQRLARWVGGFARRCRAIITCSEWCKREIVEVLDAEPSRVHVIYWGVDRTTFRPEPDIEALRHRLRSQVGITWPYFLAVACSTGRKNTPRLLRAFDKFVEQGGDHNLVAVWDPPAEVRREFDHHVAAGRLRFTGHVSDVLLRDLYAGATATIYPSLNEGFGLPMLESMSCGTPVIASDATCLPEIAGDAAVYVDPHNENAIAAAMTTFEDGSASRPALRERGLVRAAQFTWENCAARTASVYRVALA